MRKRTFIAVTLLLAAPSAVRAYDSGSTGADGALCIGDKKRDLVDGTTCVDDTDNPYDNVVVTLPPSGILNYTVVYVGPSSTLKFARNQANTPVYLLATGDVDLRGLVDVSGEAAFCAYTTGYTPTQAADLLCWGGLPGPGGDAGGSIGPAPLGASHGLGPDSGGAAGGDLGDTGADACVGSGGAGPTLTGQDGGCRAGVLCKDGGEKLAGPGWKLTHGGSGGGAAFMYWGADPAASGEVEGGGGGGGAIVIASSTRIGIYNGSIQANGAGRGYFGGGGGGGLIRLVADVVTSRLGETTYPAYLLASSNCQYNPWSSAPFCSVSADGVAACGAPGLIEIETLDQSTFALTSNPANVYFAAPRRALPWGDDPAQQPSLTITKVEDLTVPPLPTNVHPHRHPVLTIPTGVNLTVEVAGKYVPTDAAVKIGVNTVGRGRQVVSAGYVSGDLTASIWRAEIALPADTRVGDLQAWVRQITVPE